LFVNKIADWVYPEARALVEAHQRRGHTVALSSSATRYQIGGIARELAIDNVLCTELEVEDGIVTGRVIEPALWGPGKILAVRTFAADQGIDMEQSYFYADGDEDIGLMHLVGKPRPTNPRRKMDQAARRYGWPVQNFTSRGTPSLAMRTRSAVGWASVAPFTAASVGIAAVRRNRRTAATDTSRRWLDLMLSTHGIELNVTGSEHLTSHRPAVFVFNHRTDFDPLLAAAVVRDDLVGLSRPRSSRSALSRAMVQIADIVITADVSDEDSIAKAAELVTAQDISILATPEGHRDLGERLGAFDPTAFQVAMAAGVPVVPIVIRNAEALGGRHAKVLRAGTVDVAVLRPIATSRWTKRTVNARIADIRKKFLATLDDWPSSSG
jgi:putative phosphoserine phosphatase / 1-acylglycerol-3-phosphate O-acyltransferase